MVDDEWDSSHGFSTDGDIMHEDSMHKDSMHKDSMQNDSMESTRAPGHSDEWYPWYSRAVSRACALPHSHLQFLTTGYHVRCHREYSMLGIFRAAN